MGSLETIHVSSPRISFSADFLDESNFITISPNPFHEEKDQEKVIKGKEFEFLSNNNVSNPPEAMITADELFFEGKLLPFWQIHHAEKLSKISLKTEGAEEGKNNNNVNNNSNVGCCKEASEPRMSWFLDDDPSPRPPKCTVLWKELLRLKKQRSVSSLSISPSSSSSSSNSSADEGGKERENKHVKKIKKGLERTRSASMRIRPVVNVPICTQGRSSGLPPLFSMRKGRLDR